MIQGNAYTEYDIHLTYNILRIFSGETDLLFLGQNFATTWADWDVFINSMGRKKTFNQAKFRKKSQFLQIFSF